MNPNLQRIQDILRKMNLLAGVEQIRFQTARLKNETDNRRFKSRYPDFPLPPQHLAFDAHGHVNWEHYHESGMAVAGNLAGLIRTTSIISEPPMRILEWGCGPGRVIRYLPNLFPEAEICGADYNPESVAWCKSAIQGVTFVENGLRPPLPFRDGFFDVIYAISVITHLSEAVCFDWIAELSRIIKPGATLILWSNGDRIAEYLLPEEKQQYYAGAFVERNKYQEGKKMYLSFHPPTWVRSSLLPNYEVLTHLSGGFSGNEQDIWVARKPG